MASPVLGPLEAQITETRTVLGSATVLVNGIPKLISDAVAASSALGATAEQLAPFVALGDGLSADAKVLAAAVVANTPAVGEPPAEPPVDPSARRR